MSLNGGEQRGSYSQGEDLTRTISSPFIEIRVNEDMR